MKIVLSISWKCQLKCPYCWLPYTKINRKAKEHDWHEWSNVLLAGVNRGSIIDISGGEPLIYPGLVNLLGNLGELGIKWAITTNALFTKSVDELINDNPPGCVVINVSDHSGNAEAHENIKRLSEHFRVVVHRCDHPGAGVHEEGAGLITYQPWKEGLACDGIHRVCNAGLNHYVIDPGGDCWRCIVDEQVGNKPFGNIFKPNFVLPDHNILCTFGCTTCYTEDPASWQVDMKAI